MSDDHDRCGAGRGARDGVEGMQRLDVVPRRRQSSLHGACVRRRNAVYGPKRDAARLPDVGEERSPQSRQQTRRVVGRGCSQRLREGDEGAVGDAALELSQDAQLPRRRLFDDRDRVGAELQHGR